MLKTENKSQTKLKHFKFILRVSFYCDHKQIRTLTFASIYIYETKCNWKSLGAQITWDITPTIVKA